MLPSFCRVTTNGRNLPKPNYFALLPAIAPSEARGICGQRSKYQSLTEHQYVSVIEFGRLTKVVQCHMNRDSTANESRQYEPLRASSPDAVLDAPDQLQSCRITAKHELNADYRYVSPYIPTGKNVDKQIDSLKSVLKKMSDLVDLSGDLYFVYVMDDEQQCLVLPADMEEAVRQGEIESLLVSKDGSKTLFRMKSGPTVSLPTKTLSPADNKSVLKGAVYQGSAQNEQILLKQRKVREYMKRKGSDSGKKKDDKDKKSRPAAKKVKRQVSESEEDEGETTPLDVDWEERVKKLGEDYRSAINLMMMGNDWRDLIFPQISTWNWDEFPELVAPTDTQKVHDLPVYDFPYVEIPVGSLQPGFLPSKGVMNNDFTGFEAVPIFESIRPFNKQPDPKLTEAIQLMTPKPSAPVKDLFKNVETIMFLPFVSEVSSISDALERGVRGAMIETRTGVRYVTQTQIPSLGADKKCIYGMVVKIGGEDRFIVGQDVKVGQQNVFVPGQSLGTEGERRFLPGITVQDPEGPGFIPGFIFSTKKDKRFIAGQLFDTEDGKGKRFVAGQGLQTLWGPKFIAGQTIPTVEGLKFVAGQSRGRTFIPGLILPTLDGPQFISGQTFDTPQGARFIAGQILETDEGEEFVAGQFIKVETGLEFVPGQTIESPRGPLFIAGQALKIDDETKFIPGRQMTLENGQRRFIPGETLISSEGRQFIAGRIIETDDDGHRFVPCKVVMKEVGSDYDLVWATKEEDVYAQEGISDGLPIDSATFSAIPWKLPELGYMIQNAEKVKFLPTEQKQADVNVDKIVPGQLLELEEAPKFVPGKVIETALGCRFIPGQIVKTNKGEQFVPGQVVETPATGAKFFPGQVVDTVEGKKFVPGQVFETKRGPRFVPGQILVTKYGPTFVPGQVVYTDGGSRFVPGNIVETSAGPQFAPGQVLDLGYTVKFVAGQILETDSGSRYVALETDDGLQDGELIVQSFELSPEELRMITAYPFAVLHYPIHNGPLIDSRMLRQMAAAGVAIGRHTGSNLYDVKVSALDDKDNAILGANVLRKTDPVVELPKPLKKKAKSPSPPLENNVVHIVMDEVPVVVEPSSSPEFLTLPPREVSVQEGERLILTAEVEGNPDPQVVWTCNSEPVTDRAIIKNDGRRISMEIPRAQREDEGDYKIELINDAGHQSADVAVHVEAIPRDENPPSPPRFIKAPTRELSVLEGDTIKLHAVFEGFPLPQVVWTRNNEPIPPEEGVITIEGGRATLEIPKALLSDEGEYQICLKNDLGLQTAEVDVKVKELNPPSPPRFIKSPSREISVLEGDTIELVAEIDGHPPPQVTWTRNNSLIPPDEGVIKIVGRRVSLEIPRAAKTDEGEYKIALTNSSGTETADVDVKVEELNPPVPPRFVKPPSRDMTVLEGDTIKITAVVDGYPPPEVIWTYQGRPISPERGTVIVEGSKVTLEIPKALKTDEGDYQISLKNHMGAESFDVDVKVEELNPPVPPKFLKPPSRDMTVLEGDTIKITAVVDGYPPPVVVWTYQGRPVSPERGVARMEGNKAILEIPKALKTDEGDYQISLMNSLGAESCEVDVKVEELNPPQPPRFLKPPTRDLSVLEGDTIKITAVVDGFPPPEIVWTYQGRPISPDRGTVIIEGSKVTLEIPKALKTDEGDYQLSLKNAVGMEMFEVDVKVEELNPLTAPTFIQMPTREVMVDEGDTIKIAAIVDGHPPPIITWTYQGRPISPERGTVKIEGGKVTLEIPKALKADEGDYQISLSNSVGEEKAEVMVTVDVPPPPDFVRPPPPEGTPPSAPTFLTPPTREIFVDEGDTIKIKASVGGHPPPEVLWTFNDKPISPDRGVARFDGEKATLEITNAQLSDTGSYKMILKNDSGDLTADIAVKVRSTVLPPPMPKFLMPRNMTVMEGDTITMTAIIGLPLPEVTWMHNNQVICLDRATVTFEGDRCTMTIRNAIKADEGEYKLRVSNISGEREANVDIKVELIPPPPVPKFLMPRNIFIIEGSPLKLTAIVGDPLPEVTWLHNNEPIPVDRSTVTFDGDKCTMEIPSALKSDEGEYKLQVRNSSGQQEAKVDVEVEAPPAVPEFLTPPVVSVAEGTPIKLTAKIGDPPPDVTWLRNNKAISPDRAIISYDGDKCTLRIAKSKKSDEGEYKLQVSNRAGQREAKVDVLVETAPPVPKFLTPSSMSVIEGTPIKITAVVGDPRPDVVWMLNNKVVSADRAVVTFDGDKCTMEIAKSRKSDEGEYKLQVSNRAGQSESKVDVTVETAPPAPKFVTPSSMSVIEGTPIIITAIVGDPPPDVAWMLNDKAVSPDRAIITYDGDKCTMEISKARKSDEGEYKLQVSNRAGKRESTVDVTVETAPAVPKFLTPSSISVVEGTPIKLTAVIGDPRPDVVWMLNNKAVSPDRAVVTYDGDRCTMQIAKARKSDEGEYKLQVSNRAGKREAKVDVTVETGDVPLVITSAKDIPREIIDTLRYSSDETKKEILEKKLLEAIGCGLQDDTGRRRFESRRGSACIILKDFLQTIVPHDAAHDVLVGEIDYMVVDDCGVRYFESASGFASRRNSRYEIRQAAQSSRSRSGSIDMASDSSGPWPWADVGPSQVNKGRRISIDEFRKRMTSPDVDSSLLSVRRVSEDRTYQRRPGRHSVATCGLPISRSSSGYVSPMHHSRRGSIDETALMNASSSLSVKRQRKIAVSGEFRLSNY